MFGLFEKKTQEKKETLKRIKELKEQNKNLYKNALRLYSSVRIE